MVNGKEAMVEEFVLHRIGTDGDPSILNDHSAVLQGMEEQEFLRRLFLKPFASLILTCEFIPDGKNVVLDNCRKIAKGKELTEISRSIAKHLIDVAAQHEVRSGELFVVKFHGVELSGSHHDAIGIYKFDDKEVFLESRVDNETIGMQLKRGLGTRKPDQAALIVFTGDDAQTVFPIDDRPASGFWQRDFLGIQAKQDHVNSTRNVLEMTKTFITEQLPQEYEIPKADQIDLLNRSVQYFKENTEFDRESFSREVFQSDEVVDRFARFGERYQQEHEVQLGDQFEISAHAVKKQARVFKSVLKLDKNFHIYIHGDRSKIEQGTDEAGRKYYKIYYEQEL